jgi:hypothetical protein
LMGHKSVNQEFVLFDKALREAKWQRLPDKGTKKVRLLPRHYLTNPSQCGIMST